MDIRAILMGLSFALMWSSAFASARIIVAYAPPLGSLSLRFLVAGLLGILIAKLIGQSLRGALKQWQMIVVFGLCQNALYLGLNFVAMQRIEASLAAIIASLMPLIVAAASLIGVGQRPGLRALLGMIGGLGGVVLIMGGRLSGGVDPVGVAYCLIAALALSVATLAMRGASRGGNLLMVVGLQMLVGAVILAVVSSFTETHVVIWDPKLGWAFAYTTIVPGLMATALWFALVSRIGALKAATFHFLNPFFGVAIAAWLLGETLSILDVVGVTIVTIGILVVQLERAKAAATA